MSMTDRILQWAWDRRDAILEKLGQIRDWWRGSGENQGEVKGVLLLGPGGVGKSTLGLLLAGEYDFLIDVPGQYKESMKVEHYSLPAKGGPAVEIVVPPGQKRHREPMWTDLLADVVAGKFRGVVLLAAYGYHSLDIGWRELSLGRQHPDEAAFLKAFTEEKREDEIAVLRTLADALRLNRERMWLLTVVTKQDLWWKEREAVGRHYREGGRYGGVMQGVVDAQDQRRFRHELVFGSLVISNFTTGVGELLKPNSEGYDHPLQVGFLRKLFETVDALKNWESGK